MLHGVALWNAGRHQDAYEVFTAASTIAPNHPSALFDRAHALSYTAEPDWEEVLRLLDDALRFGWRYELGSTFAHELRARALSHLGRDAEAADARARAAYERGVQFSLTR